VRDGVVLIASLSSLAAATSALRLVPGISATTISLAFLLLVLATATVGRLWLAIVVSVAAMLTLNFFFLPPVGTFTIADPQNWIALFAVAIAIERAQFLAERDAADLVRQKADLAATLLASLSHDLRTPLTAIQAAVENLRGELPPAEWHRNDPKIVSSDFCVARTRSHPSCQTEAITLKNPLGNSRTHPPLSWR
jgi:K+-sensing histidine kinase KdpD